MPNAKCQMPNEQGISAFQLGIWHLAFGIDLAQRVISISTYLIPVALALFVFAIPARPLLLIGLIATLAAALVGFICWRVGRNDRRLRAGLGLAIYGAILAGAYVPLLCSHSLPGRLHQLNTKSTPIAHER